MTPRFVVSACLAGEPCRYDGQSNPCPEVITLVAAGLAIPLCPEQLGGLPTPRTPCELRGGNVVSRTGDDMTKAFLLGVERAMRTAKDSGCAAAILKSRSPSCSPDGVYDGSFTRTCVAGQGLWARKLRLAGFTLYSEENLPPLQKV